MKIKIVFFVFLFLLVNFTFGQVKFRVKKLNADSLFALLPEKDGIEKIEVLNLLSNVICRKDIDSSINLANQAISLSEPLEYQKGLADGYYNLGNGYFLSDSLQLTISNYLKAVRIYEDLEPTGEYGHCCLQLALMNYFTRGPEESPPYLNKAIEVLNNIGNNEDKYNINFTLAVSHDVVYPPKPDSIIYYGYKAMQYIDTATDHTELAYIYSEIGEGYSPLYTRPADTSDLTTALSWFFKALKLQGITDDLKITLYLNIASTYLDYNTTHHISEAIFYLEKAKKMPDTCVGVYDQKPAIFQMLGSISYNQGDFHKAISLYKQGIRIAEQRLLTLVINEYPEPIHAYNNRYYIKYDRQLMYEGIYDSYVKLGQFEKALEYTILSKKAADEIFLEQNQNLLIMLEAVSIDEKNKSQIELLASENELHKMKVTQSRTWMIVMGGFVLIFVFVSLMFIRQRKIRIEHKTLLREQKLLHKVELKNVESKKLKELDHMKSQFFANISHEFRTPLTLILSPAEKLINKVTDESMRSELLLIQRYARRLRRLINQLLSLSKLEAGKLTLNAKNENIIKLVKNYTQSFESLAKQRQIKLSFNSEINELIGSIDHNKLEIVINNILSNAFKFTGEGGQINVSITPLPPSRGDSVRVSPLEGGQRGVTIEISDTGRGISPEHLEHIFERFYLVENTNYHHHEGTGIGLAIAKELVELHNGEIQVESEIDKGTTLRIIIPVEVSEDSIEEKSGFEQKDDLDLWDEFIEQPTETLLPTKKSKKKFVLTETDNNITNPLLLIVEDNPDLRTHICYHLSEDFNIIEAQDGEEGFSEAIENIPDIIISDIMMPKMDGYELSKKLKTDERTSHIPIVLLTARASKESRIQGLETGADDFITKPFDIDELLVRVKNLVEQRKRLSKKLEKKIQKSQNAILFDFEDSGITSMDEKFLNKILSIIKERYIDPDFNVEIFCQTIGLSRIQLHRKIKALVRMTTSEVIRTYRLNKAAEMLKEKSATIAEIAYDVGFSSPSYFSECFRKQFGKSPSEFNGNK